MKKIYQLSGFGILLAVLIGMFVFTSNNAAMSQDKAEVKSPWTVRCAENAQTGTESCETFQRLTVKQTGQRLIEFVVGKNAEKPKVSRGVVILPLGVLIKAGIRMQIDELPAYKFDLHHCTEGGCFAFVDLNKDIISKMKKGESAKMTMKSIDGKNVNIVMSLQGFGAAFEKIK